MIKIKKYPLKVIKCSVLYKFIKRPLLKQLRISCLSYEYQTSVTNIHFISYEYHESLLIWVKIISALKTDASFDVFFPLTALLAWVYRVTTQNLFWGPAVGSDILAKYPKTRIFLTYAAAPPPFWIFVTTVTNIRCGTLFIAHLSLSINCSCGESSLEQLSSSR